MTNLQSDIKLIENEWLKITNDYLQKIFEGVHLPSHDLSHHLRVWNYCKSILQELHSKGVIQNSPETITQALIACLFHDTGLTQTLNERHGLESRRLCNEFLSLEGLPLSDFMPALRAIEHHDDKQTINLGDGTSDLTRMVSTADDMDALGYIGVYRYIEIYLARGVPLNHVADRAKANMELRFQNLKNFMGEKSNFTKDQSFRYRIGQDTFDRIKQMDTSNEIYSIISNYIIEGKLSLKKTHEKVIQSDYNLFTKKFFEMVTLEH